MKDNNVYTFRASDGNTVKLEYREFLLSSADLAREYAEAGYPDRYAVFTERQLFVSSGGNGAPRVEGEQGLFLSCILRPSIFRSQAGLVRALSAVALVTALDEHVSSPLSIGWLSTIYCNGKKIGHCNIESKFDDHSSYEYLILNFSIKTDKKVFPPRLEDMMRKVFESDNVSVGMIMAKSILNRFFSIYRELKTPAKHMEVYRSRSAFTGKKVKYVNGQTKRTVKVLDVEKETCTLIVETKDGEKIRVNSPSRIMAPNRI